MSLLVTLDRVKNIIKTWIKERNLIIEEIESDRLILREGDNTILLKIIVFEDIPDIDELNREITILASRRSDYNKMYIVVSRDIAHLLDGKLLKKLGIGVLSVDIEEGEVKEILTSPAISVRKVESIDISRIETELEKIVRKIVLSELEPIRRELENIKNLVQRDQSHSRADKSALESLNKIREEIENIWNVIDRLKIEIERIKNLTSSISENIEDNRREGRSVEKTEAVEQSTVPDFIRDNPWVQILANKVRE
ncbi:MAG: hypothetical protein GXO10_03850 [Crenarchaeota archaeon]|nr:hypothetical protein [Thermoproteota archaeon]